MPRGAAEISIFLMLLCCFGCNRSTPPNPLVGEWVSPESGWTDSEYGPVRFNYKFESRGVVETKLIVSVDSPGGGGTIEDSADFSFNDGVLSSPAIDAGHPVRIEFRGSQRFTMSTSDGETHEFFRTDEG